MPNGIYLGNPTKESLMKLADLKPNFIILKHSAVTNLELIKEIFPNVDIYISYRCFEGKELSEKFPDAITVDAQGKPTISGDYFPVSPVNKDVREFHLSEIESFCTLGIKGFWLDHFQFPTKWDTNLPDILDTDFSESAIKEFEGFIGEEIEGNNIEEKYLHIDGSYYHEWLQFKSGILVSFADEVKKILSPKNMTLSFFAIPWEEQEYGAGIKRIIAQDHSILINHFDETGIMFYYNSVQSDVEWIKNKIEYFWQLGTYFYSVIEVGPNFDEALEQASKSPSKGIILRIDNDFLNESDSLTVATDFFGR